jgi:hypothetical protein
MTAQDLAVIEVHACDIKTLGRPRLELVPGLLALGDVTVDAEDIEDVEDDEEEDEDLGRARAEEAAEVQSGRTSWPHLFLCVVVGGEVA